MASLNKVNKFYMFNFTNYNMELYHLILTGLMSILVDVEWVQNIIKRFCLTHCSSKVGVLLLNSMVTEDTQQW